MMLSKPEMDRSLDKSQSNSAIVRLSPCFEATPLGLVVTGSPTLDEWIETGDKLRTVESGLQWCRGDWLCYGEGRGDWGERYTQAMEETGKDYDTLQHYWYVSGRIEFRRRRRNLEWSHHQEVAPLEPEEQDTWLDLAEQNEWSRTTLRRAIKESKPSEYPIWLKYNDVWNIPDCDDRFGIEFPGRIPGQIIQNLLYYYTEEGDLVIDPMAGGGTSLDVCRHEGRRCFAFDILPARDDISYADATKPWPTEEPADLVFIDPPYWCQLEGDYGGMAAKPYQDYLMEMQAIIGQAHINLKGGGILAILIAPMAVKTEYIDIPFDLLRICETQGFTLIRRVSVPVLGNQQAGPQVMEQCKRERKMAASLRDLLILQNKEITCPSRGNCAG